ncbi:hypothetical protein Bca4012_071371 [Brassica carinata]|uniref:Uncharacterized protein n=1 Tax=Brassica carinata TaxID=52824 RepID=A0A8X7QER4_BRACI|nr:hypothetical protein Bca52824_063651 [Brassica carinata]
MAALRRSKKKKLSHRLIHSMIGRSRILHVNLRRWRNPISLRRRNRGKVFRMRSLKLLTMMMKKKKKKKMVMVTRRRTQSHWPTTFSMVAMMKRNLWVLILTLMDLISQWQDLAGLVVYDSQVPNGATSEYMLVSICGSLDGQQWLVVKGRFAPKNSEEILLRYISK